MIQKALRNQGFFCYLLSSYILSDMMEPSYFYGITYGISIYREYRYRIKGGCPCVKGFCPSLTSKFKNQNLQKKITNYQTVADSDGPQTINGSYNQERHLQKYSVHGSTSSPRTEYQLVTMLLSVRPEPVEG